MAAVCSFGDIKPAQPIEVFALVAAFNEDSHPDKVNLSVGAYRTDESKPWVLPVVRKVEVSMANDQSLNKEYLPVAGLKDYTDTAAKILLGNDSSAIHDQRVFGVQALGGTGALRIGMDLMNQQCGVNVAYVTDPTWGNHIGLLKAAGYEVRKYNYWNAQTHSLDWESMKRALLEAPENAMFILHAVAHNPTGVDLSQEQWKEVATIMKDKKLVPLFDVAYQGFASGDLETDGWVVRYFVDQGFEMCCAQSFSKNFGMYNERCGNLTVICKDKSTVPAVKSQTELIVRTTWSNPPNHGARVIATVLGNSALLSEWKENVKVMAERIMSMRKVLYEKLKSKGTPGSWEHIIQQNGMFSYTGLNVRQCEFLMRERHIYLLRSGRINMCGLTTKNAEYVATAIHDAITQIVDDPKL